MRSRATQLQQQHSLNNTSLVQPMDGGPRRDLAPGISGPKPAPVSLRLQRNLLAVACLFLSGWVALLLSSNAFPPTSLNTSIRGGIGVGGESSDCQFYLGPYRGPQYYSPESGTVGTPQCIVESKWLKLSQHSVKFPGSTTTFDDWMWIDYHDRINVLVEDNTSNTKQRHNAGDEERQFLVFQQSKYALEGRTSKAIIGGIIEPGEDPEAAARREVEEEMNGLQCDQFHALGRYRTDVNRGMGWLHGFLATGCSYDDHSTKKKQGAQLVAATKEEVGAADTERQALESITLTELRELVRNGDFLEVQWTATVALALLHPELINS